MTRTNLTSVMVGAIVVASVINAGAQTRKDQVGGGAQWLSWSSKERATYVGAFIDGYLSGTHQLCRKADDLFRVRDPHYQNPKVMPGNEASALCYSTRSEYSRIYSGNEVDFSFYVDAITEFYSKYPQDQSILVGELMLSLADGKCSTVEELHQKVLKGELLRVPTR